jgi:hypothetical protein
MVDVEFQKGTIPGIRGISLTGDMTVQQVMEAAYDLTKFEFVIQWYGAALGYAVIALNDVASSPGTGEYWFLFLRDSAGEHEAHGGMDETSVRPGETVVWKYLHYSVLTTTKAKARAAQLHALASQKASR